MPIKALLKKTPIGTIYARHKFMHGVGQSDETEILSRLTKAVEHPHTFVEFGYHLSEFNCIHLARTYSGLLIDGDRENVALTRRVMPPRIQAEAMWITRDNLSIIRAKYPQGTLGVLSVDVDGNDYWFLSDLMDIEPAIISVEYNASLGLRDLTVLYDQSFARFEKHPSGLYHGASLVALDRLCRENGYSLVETSSNGTNAFFVRTDLLPGSIPAVTPEAVYRENAMRNKMNNSTAAEQWQNVKDMPYAVYD